MKIFGNIFSSKPKSIYTFIQEGNLNEVRDYFKDAKDLNYNSELEKMLFFAIDNCENNYFEVIEILINNGADINSHHGNLSETPLHRLCARSKPRMDVIAMLLEKGVEVNGLNISGKTPIFYCTFSYSVELLNLLVKYGADINIRDKYKNTLLHDDYIGCPDENFEEFLKALISLGFDINSKNSLGLTPLEACQNENIKAIMKKYA
ncbi:ankyrin repeat domain-containing protein [Clostridium sp. OS1-26]|uniref:ankyrin repeat domain-containing protein n=1 Tax=Clostridium sp. OS1-26 TaxID=3070681 RepID=UPI0027DF9EC5|nr:ankyrin repeat domain-containing protein [Clostridium sp. OS1-26]WML33399.1 ankyrin repeat domain-containing protein [Clostridium sp. OS1-26]